MKTVQHLVSVSGGKDSTATYLKAIESERQFQAVFADTGNEHEITLEYVATLAQPAGGPKIETVRADLTADLARHRDYILRVWPLQGIPQEIVDRSAALHTPSGNPFVDLCILKGRFPSRGAQFCTEELKVLPIVEQRVLPMLKSGPVLQWVGIRAEESENRARQPIYNRHESGSYLWRPIFDWKLKDVWAYHSRHGILPNPLYAMGFGRVGCFPCINCRKDELRLIADLAPEHIERIAEWEAIVAMVSKRQSATFFAPMKDPTDADTPGEYSRIHKVVEWSRTGRGGRQFDLFFQQQPGGGCTSDLGLCELAEAA
ncbi:phosphoadenosine phosphosulfate reductase family protein [Xanthomonas arboricola]|uniref:phosphoadenosine phosphosulfate reductase domain-containing protein n=1 Tax=Xanthomonas arboricola TaxID=56448 RepID=UPI00160FE2E6|nr:phosphoadenosine phosphosulfate reductase family protein [Xanthomonas arboricola]MBB5675540.1 3'-phosphoadenosine 5'-phosphosulfate sulfotransferase (PAPS reductase)/FAD synthetase [Xanthomonas arboricola]